VGSLNVELRVLYSALVTKLLKQAIKKQGCRSLQVSLAGLLQVIAVMAKKRSNKYS